MKRVMVVDDERPVVEGITLMVDRDLGEEFAVVGSASSGREALERSGELAPDIVLMDVSMPGISGLEAVRELRRRGSTAAFILVTAYERFDIAREAVELGLLDYLLKPVSREALAAALREAALWLDKLRENEAREVRHREREESLLVFAEVALLHGILLGEGRGPKREAALRALGVAETWAMAVAVAFTPTSLAKTAREEETAELHARFKEALRYRSRALVGPPVSNTSLVLLPCRDAGDATARRGEFREALTRGLGTELARGRLRLGFGSARPIAEATTSWSEALADLASSNADLDRPRAAAEGLARFEDDEELLRSLVEGDEAGATLALAALLGADVGLGDDGPLVSATTAGRISSIFGAAYRTLARRGHLDPREATTLLDLRDLCGAEDSGTLALAARARLARLKEATAREPRHSPTVARTIAWIKDQYKRPIGLEAAADAIGVSPHHLSRLLVEETGRGFSDLLIEYRIERAKELLAEPGASVKEVSMSSGYPDPNYFSRLFKKVTGLTPTAWAAGKTEGDDE